MRRHEFAGNPKELPILACKCGHNNFSHNPNGTCAACYCNRFTADDPHCGASCEEVELDLDRAQGELNWIGENLVKRGYKVDFRENDSHWHWVEYALLHGKKKRTTKRWWRR
jgi:hypothetical protein